MFVVVVTAVAVVETVLAVRNAVPVLRVFRGDLEGVKIMACPQALVIPPTC